MSRSITCCC